MKYKNFRFSLTEKKKRKRNTHCLKDTRRSASELPWQRAALAGDLLGRDDAKNSARAPPNSGQLCETFC